MKSINYLFFIALFFYSSCMTAQKKDVIASDKLLKFYSSYIIESDKMGNKEKIDSLLSKYCTRSFIDRINNDDELDADPILDIQDVNKNWVKTLTVKTLLIDEKYLVCFSINTTKKQTHCINVFVKQEAGEWKIDNVIR